MIILRPLVLLVSLIFLPLLAWSDNVRDIGKDWLTGTVEYPPLPAAMARGRSVVLFDVDTGTIVMEQDSASIIPPASMTKLVTMSLVFRHLAAGGISLDSPVELPPETWSINAPPRSSLMFLGQGQHCTWNDLLAGLAVSSGNDAAVAAAVNVAGSVETFVERMNALVTDLGLKETRFVEPSGYDARNRTTAREWAYLVYWYLKNHPEALAWHSMASFTYPRSENLVEGADPVLGPITQYNRNQLLKRYPGADGLKTGFIDESGYNLSFTATRNGMRVAGVILGTASEDERINEAGRMLDLVFGEYRTIELRSTAAGTITLYGADRGRLVIPAQRFRTTLPLALVDRAKGHLEVPDELMGPFGTRHIVGHSVWKDSQTGMELARFPISSPIEVGPADPVYGALDSMYLSFRSLWGRQAPPRPAGPGAMAQ